MSYLNLKNLKENIYELIDNKIDQITIYNIFDDIKDKDLNTLLNALKLNKTLKCLSFRESIFTILSDFSVINENNLIKPFKAIIKTLNNINGFKLFVIKNIYNINTLNVILQNNINFNLDITLECCNMKSLLLLPKHLKNHKNKILLKLNVFENNYYKNFKIFKKYEYYYNNMNNISYLTAYGYDPLNQYSKEELNDIYENNKKYEELFNKIALKSMYTIIDDLILLVDFLRNHKNITLKIHFNYMFRKRNNIRIFNSLFYEKYGTEIKSNILFERNV